MNAEEANAICNRVFVYGSLRRQHGNFRILERSNATHVGDYTLQLPYQMYSMGAFPALVEVFNTLNHITGEVYEVTPEGMQSLDWLEGYPNFYDRTLVQTPSGGAWVYHLADRDVGSLPVVESGDWAEYLKGEAA